MGRSLCSDEEDGPESEGSETLWARSRAIRSFGGLLAEDLKARDPSKPTNVPSAGSNLGRNVGLKWRLRKFTFA